LVYGILKLGRFSNAHPDGILVLQKPGINPFAVLDSSVGGGYPAVAHRELIQRSDTAVRVSYEVVEGRLVPTQCGPSAKMSQNGANPPLNRRAQIVDDLSMRYIVIEG
jgi:hypothetical protein